MGPRVVTWLASQEVPAFRFTQAHANRLHSAWGAQVQIALNEADLLAALPAAEIVLTWKFQQEWFGLAPRLRWIATPAAGRDYLAGLQLPPGVRISYGRFHGEFMAETVLGMMLAETRGITATLRTAGPWPRAESAPGMVSLRGSQVVILGFGNIGQWIGRLLEPFGVRLIGIRRQAVPPSLGVADLDRVLPTTDHLIVVLPADEDSRNLLDARRLALLPRHAVLYSIGRGHCIDETALATALHHGQLRAAYLDVFQQEPLPADSPLRRAPNAVLLPHISAVAPQYLDRFVDQLLQEAGSTAYPATHP